MIFHKPRNTRPAGTIDVRPLTRAALLAAPNHSVFRLGHSTVLLKLRDKFWLTDPVFSERASPVQWAGPKRFHQPPISLEELPPIEAVILSHDHYDHLDQHAILKLAAKTRYFLAPLGVGDTLVKWGIDAGKVRQLIGGKAPRWRASNSLPHRPNTFRGAACSTATARYGPHG